MEKRLQRTVFFRSLFLQACWNEERMQNLGFALCMQPWLSRLYPRGGMEARDILRRHLEFFNTQPYMAGIICGVTARLEEAAVRESSKISRIRALKAALGAALAGIGDKFFWGTYRPFCTACALGTGLTLHLLGGSILESAGAIVAAYLLLFNIPALWVRWHGIRWGYDRGEAVVEKIKQMGWQRQVRRFRRAGRFLSLALAVAMLFLMVSNFPAPIFEKIPVRAAVFVGCLGIQSLRVSALRAYGLVLGGSLLFAFYRIWL